jgi:hypothetical protein
MPLTRCIEGCAGIPGYLAGALDTGGYCHCLNPIHNLPGNPIVPVPAPGWVAFILNQC